MNKSDLVERVAAATSTSKAAAGAAVDAVFDGITAGMKAGERVQISGFGTFEVRHRGARMARNPQTGAAVWVSSHNAPAFKAGKGLKDAVN
ncbi:MAG TPA: HU family DNA-binding protein [Acidimicrobiia bacterium]